METSITWQLYVRCRLLIFVTGLLISMAHGQSNDFHATVIPPSPTSDVFNRYGNHQPAIPTGMIQIPIPIYELVADGYSLPFSLQYRTNGINFQDRPFPLGYGWMFSPGLRITRTVMSRPDDLFPMQQINFTEDYGELVPGIIDWTNFDYTYHDLTAADLYDTQHDIFTVHLPSGSHSFLLVWTGTTYQVVTVGHRLKIVALFDSSRLIYGFSVTDEQGNEYVFGEQGATPLNKNFSETPQSQAYKTAWVVRNINLPNNTSIGLTWGTYTITDFVPQVYYPIQVRDFWNWACDPHSTPQVIDYGGLIYINPYSQVLMLQQVTFPSGSIQLTYKASNNPFLTKFEVRDVQNTVRSETVFTYGTLGPDQNHALLQSVKTDGLKHQFTYNSHRFGKNTASLDYWGFYNGKSNMNLIPKIKMHYYTQFTVVNGAQVPNLEMEVGNADRSVSDAHMQAFMLMRIDYPTGGYSEFEYEPHQFTDRYPQSTGAFATMPAPLNKGGGLRVKKITEKADAAAPARITQYKYGENENGLARVQVVPTLDTFVDELWYFQRIPTPNCQLSFNFQTYRNLSINGLSDYSKYLIGTTPIWYEEVSEYVNEEKTTYKYQYMEDLITHLLSFKLITRPFVFSYQGLFQEGPQLTERIAYRKSGSSYLPVERHKRYYDWMNVSPYQVNSTIIDRKIVLQSFEPFEPGADLYADFFLYTHYGVNINEIDYHRIPYSIRPSYYRMNREETIRYPEVGVPFAQEVSYAYVEDYSTRLRQSSRSSSDAARDIRTYLTYSTDYGDAIHVAMQNKHMVGMPIEQQTYNGSLETRRVRTNYTNSAPITTGLILPGSIQTSTTGASGLENELVFNAYDNRGNPLQATPRKAPAESYLWDYQGQQVVASVTNAVRTDIAYASFEAEGKGNWSYSGATIADATAPTGRRAYNLSGGSLSKTGLNSSVTYLLSYWAKSASAGSISGGAATAVRNHNGWTQYVREFSGLTSLTLSGSALIDEVRLHPKVALMTSFTFDPLVGMTSQTDASGRIVYYYYDSYRRLQAIRDLNGNLVQSFCYNIKGEPIDCSTPLPY